MKTKECKVLINNTENKKRGGRGETSEPSGINRHPSRKCVRAKLGTFGNGFTFDDVEEILQFHEQPKALLLRYFARKTDPLMFHDWVIYIQQYYDLHSEIDAYFIAEEIPLHYFGVTRFDSFDSYRVTWQKAFKAKKAKMIEKAEMTKK